LETLLRVPKSLDILAAAMNYRTIPLHFVTFFIRAAVSKISLSLHFFLLGRPLGLPDLTNSVKKVPILLYAFLFSLFRFKIKITENGSIREYCVVSMEKMKETQNKIVNSIIELVEAGGFSVREKDYNGCRDQF